MNTTFSIVMPVYNVEKYIEKSLSSILAQTFKDFELICVDDCGDDNSMQIVEDFAKSDSRIKIIRQPFNVGTGATRNNGINHASGKYLCVIDADDWIEPDYLESIYDAFQRNPEAHYIIFKFFQEYDKDVTSFSIPYFPYYFAHKGGWDKVTPDKLFSFPIFCWTKAYDLAYLKQNGICFAEMTYEEYLLHVHLLMQCPKVYILNKKIYHYLQRPNSWTTTRTEASHKMNLENLIRLYGMVDSLIETKKYNNEYKQYCYQTLDRFKQLRLNALEALNKGNNL